MQDESLATSTQTHSKERILQVIPLHSTLSTDCLTELETHVRSLLSIDDCIGCHSLMTVSYCKFKMSCIQQMKGKWRGSSEVAFGRGYFARLTPNNIVLVFKTTDFGLPIQPATQRHVEMDTDN